jgi:oligopeptide/dipeptide ABC transporter ATP-binding protein
MSLLEVEALRVRHRRGGDEITVLDGVGLRLDAGEALGLVGESGSGKSQTALAIMGLLPASATVEGSIRLDGEELVGAGRAVFDRLRGSRIAMVFQDPMSSLNPYRTIGVQLTEGMERRLGMARGEALAEAARLLDAVRIAAPRRCLGQHPHELSGGMCQRVMIAMALAGRPRLLIADEPTTALDVTVQAEVLAVLDALRRELDLALLLITHDLGVVAGHCERMAVMYAGRIIESGPSSALLASPAHPYTAALLAARPSLHGPRPARLAAIPGQPPDPARRLVGCAFAPRCALVEPRCTDVRPTLLAVARQRHCACVRTPSCPDEPDDPADDRRRRPL